MNELYEEIRDYLPIIGIGLVIFVASLIPYATSTSETVSIPYEKREVKTADYELGDTVATEDGLDGESTVTYETYGSLLQRFFSNSSVAKTEVSRDVVTEPSDEVVSIGTKRYRYMHCSDGSYWYYTDSQWKDKNVGYTSKSDDQCVQKGTGHMTRLANSPPDQRPRCIDVTSYDYNWNNDVLCTNPDGSQYYTSYEGAGW